MGGSSVLVSMDLVARGLVSINFGCWVLTVSSVRFFSGEVGLGNILAVCGDVNVSGGVSFVLGLSCTGAGAGAEREGEGESTLTGSSSSSSIK